MNIDFLKYNYHAQTEEYLDMLHSNNISPIITKPTRITNYTATLIDHIYTNNTNQMISGIATIDISDHLPTFCIVDIPLQKQKLKRYYRDYRQFDSELYLQDVKAIDWNSIYTESNDLNEIATKTISTLQLIVDKHVPRKLISQSKQKQFSKPWITNGILKSIKNKQGMYRTHFLSNNPVKTAEYKKYANKLNHLKTVSKRVYYCKQFNLHRNNLKVTWKLIGTLIKRNTKGQMSPSRIIMNNKTFTNKLDIAEQFNKYFISVGPSLASTIDDYDEVPTKYINKSPVSSFIMSPVEATQVCRLFQNLNENKTSLDIPNKLIKIASEPLSIPFAYIYNQSIANGIVPDVFKISRVTPIYKSGEVTDTGNYRPIATLSSFSKVLERLVYNQLYLFLEKNDIIYKYQFGFRKGYSTEQAILEITDNLNSAIDNKQITCGLFLDFSKAFDTVNHNILLSKLYTYGIRGTPFKWFQSYLCNRTQFVKIDEIESSMETITCGVPQGSTLGPLLFLLYINDLPNSSEKLSFRIFADDTNIFFTGSNPNEVEFTMNEEIKLVLKYCAINKLSVNFKKTNYMLITSSKKKIHLNIHNIDRKSYIKYLGIYLDEHLQWEPQIQHVNNKLAKNVGIINKLRNYLDFHMLKQLYYTLIYPYLNYGLASWGTAYKTRLNKICTKQNRCIRSMFFAHGREHVDSYYNLLGILKFENIYRLKVSLFIYKFKNDKSNTPAVLLNILIPASDIHSYNTRYAANQNFFKPSVRTNYGISTFKFSAIKIWESVPLELKRFPYMLFKKKYKRFLLSTQLTID